MRIILILLTLGSFLNNCYANTITVTSNADSGSGSLREAITIANSNGIAITDTIIFNISETIFNQRIIELNDELPPISSNTIIDGTTQPGDVYGTTDAKICIKKNQYAPSFSMLTIENADHVEIYDLVLKKFALSASSLPTIPPLAHLTIFSLAL